MEEEKAPEVSLSGEQKPLIHSLNNGNMFTPKVIVAFVLVILLGIVSGYFLTGKKVGSVTTNTTSTPGNSNVESGTVVGSNDTNTFKDIAEGTLREGGIDGEGAFHLERPGGSSQNVYLTSSIVDLSKFVGKKIKVWGQTQAAQHAGWLMDVGKIQVL